LADRHVTEALQLPAGSGVGRLESFKDSIFQRSEFFLDLADFHAGMASVESSPRRKHP